MKTKRFSKKLKLNKKTIADLKSNEMTDVHGGELAPRSYPYTGCYVCLPDTASGNPCIHC